MSDGNMQNGDSKTTAWLEDPYFRDIQPISVVVDVCGDRYFVHWGLDNPPRLNCLEFSDAQTMVEFALALAAKSGIDVKGLRRAGDVHD
jgi:hypothetical protein